MFVAEGEVWPCVLDANAMAKRAPLIVDRKERQDRRTGSVIGFTLTISLAANEGASFPFKKLPLKQTYALETFCIVTLVRAHSARLSCADKQVRERNQSLRSLRRDQHAAKECGSVCRKLEHQTLENNRH